MAGSFDWRRLVRALVVLVPVEVITLWIALDQWRFHHALYALPLASAAVAVGWFKRWSWRRVAAAGLGVLSIVWACDLIWLLTHDEWGLAPFIATPIVLALIALGVQRDLFGLAAFCAVASMWTSLVIPDADYVYPVVLVGVVGALLWRRDLRNIAVIGLLAPPVPFFIMGSLYYAQGRAVSWGSATEATTDRWERGLDRETRLHGTQFDYGCVSYPNSWHSLARAPYNFAVHGLVRRFGPQPGAYDGPYPDDAQISAALRSATPITWVELATDRIRVDGMEVVLPEGFGAQSASSFGLYSEIFPHRPPPRVLTPRIALFEERVFILELRPATYFNPAPGELGYVVLFDRESGDFFAHIL